jgi:hypothetical protein
MDCLKESEIIILAAQATQMSDDAFDRHVAFGLHNNEEAEMDTTEATTVTTPEAHADGTWDDDMVDLYARLAPNLQRAMKAYWQAMWREHCSSGLPKQDLAQYAVSLNEWSTKYMRQLLSIQEGKRA